MDIRTALIFLPGFLTGITIHEASHAMASKWLGDRCAESCGRISLNPLRHLSAAGTLLLFLVGFGWGKPVPVNIYNYKHPKLYHLLCSLAGPASNIVLAILLVLVGIVLNIFKISLNETILDMVVYGVIINLLLAFINLIPIPPLDGSAIWPCLIPGLRPVYSGRTMKFWIIILFLIFIFHVPSRAAEFAGRKFGRQFFNYIQKIKYGEPAFPANYPAQMQPPDGAYWVHYDQTSYTNGDPNMYTASFFLEEPYPATGLQNQLAKKLAEDGWSQIDARADNNDPNGWETNGTFRVKDVEYRVKVWSKTWENENAEFNVRILWFTDPNHRSMSDILSAKYKYTIKNPVSTE